MVTIERLRKYVNENAETCAVAIILALALMFRMMLLGLHCLHMDECLYANYAIRMLRHGDLTLNGGLVVDKPPFFFYFIALSFLINGISENAARLPNMIFSLVTVYYLYKFAKAAYPESRFTPVLSAFFLAFSSYYTVFSVTAFQDISMTAFLVMSLYYLKKDRFFLSPFLYFLSITCKPMTLFIFPVYLAFYLLQAGFKIDSAKLKQAGLAGLYVFGPLVLWSAFLANPRWGIFRFFETQQPGVLSVTADFGSRFMDWLGQSAHIVNGYMWLALAAIGPLIFVMIRLIKGRVKETAHELLPFFAAAYIYVFLSLMKFRVFDRYLIVAVPFLALGLGRLFSLVEESGLFKKPAVKAVLLAAVCFAYMLPMRGLDKSGMNMGALFTASDGFDRVAKYIKARGVENIDLVYYGNSIGWYGYFYLADEKFYRVSGAHTAEQLARIETPKGKSLLVVVNARDREKSEVEALKAAYRTVYTSGEEDGRGEKFFFDGEDK